MKDLQGNNFSKSTRFPGMLYHRKVSYGRIMESVFVARLENVEMQNIYLRDFIILINIEQKSFISWNLEQGPECGKFQSQ